MIQYCEVVQKNDERMYKVLEWFAHNLGLVFLVYGMTYVIIATAILAHNRKNSEYELAGVLWLFAVYALFHAPADFINMWYTLTVHEGGDVQYIGTLLTYAAYAFLFEFGRRVLLLPRPTTPLLSWYVLPALAMAIVVFAFLTADVRSNVDALIGYGIRFPAGVAAGIGIICYYRNLRESLQIASLGKYFYSFGMAIILWAIFCGIVREKGSFFPSTVLNVESFFRFVHVPVFLFRSLCGLVAAWAVIGMLNMFHYEKQARLATALESESRTRNYLERIIANITDPLVVTDPVGRIVLLNSMMESMIGCREADLAGEYIGAVLMPEDRKRVIDPAIISKTAFEGEVLFIGEEGEGIPAVFSLSPIAKGDDQGIEGFIGLAKDITLRKRIEAALVAMAGISAGGENKTPIETGTLREEHVKRNVAEMALLDSYRFLQSIIDSVNDEVIVRSRENRIEMMNIAARRRMSDMAGSDACCVNMLDGSVYPCDDCGNGNLVNVVRDAGKTVFFERIFTRGQKRHIFEVSASPLLGDDGGLVGIVEVGRDVTDRRELERDVLRVYESEQQRIGQDLHDDLMQNLIAIDVLLKMAANSMKTKHAAEEEQDEELMRLREITRFLGNAISKTRRLARGLCPVALGQDSFIPAIRQMVNETAEIYGMECAVDIHVEEFPLDELTARHLYYIAKEAVTNVGKHSGATQIHVCFTQTADGLEMRVMDNGRGCDSEIGCRDGLGMRIMKYRADMIGAKFSIASGSDGTSVICIAGLKSV